MGLLKTVFNWDRISRIRMRIHNTWYVAFALITAAVATQFPESYPLWQRIMIGIFASLLFFIAISIRQFILNFAALHRGIPVTRVTLFVFGGVFHTAKEPRLPVLELLLAATGLLTNLIIAGIFYGVSLVLVITAGSVMIAGVIQWLAFICFILALFHFVPAFPLDGGRLLRVLLWKTSGNYDRSTRIAIWSGWGISPLFIVVGIVVIALAREWFIGLLLAFMGWVLWRAVAISRHHMKVREALQDVRARDVMTKEYPLISVDLSLTQLVRDYVMMCGQDYFVVVDDVSLQGVVTLRDIRRIPKKRWDSTRVGAIMRPAGEVETAYTEEIATGLFEQMDESKISHMPVLENDKVVGMIAQDNLARLVKNRATLRI